VKKEAAPPTYERPTLRCFLAAPYALITPGVGAAVRGAVEQAGFRLVTPDDHVFSERPLSQVVAGELARADCVVADLTGRDPNVLYEVGLAQAMGKALFLLVEEDEAGDMPSDLDAQPVLRYAPTAEGLSRLSDTLGRDLARYRAFPRRRALASPTLFQPPFFVDWDRLDRAEAENLCQELLAQMGFQQIDWWTAAPEFDLVAELPKRDPDGHEYRELWLVAMGRNAPLEMVFEKTVIMGFREPEYLAHRLFRSSRRGEELLSKRSGDTTITILFVLLGSGGEAEHLESMRDGMEHMARRRGGPASYRVRIWDRAYLTSLVQQFPQIGYKYFSDEARAQSKYRKTPEELYQENVSLAERLAATVNDLEAEKNLRVRAERDAAWKDISFSAAHKIGNPIFAIETDLDPLLRRVREWRMDEATEVIENMRSSVEKAKAIVDQFKSLTRAQQITPVAMPLRPILDAACQAAPSLGITCAVECLPDLEVRGDPERLAECFDELIANAMRWFDKPDRRIEVVVSQPESARLPNGVDSTVQYALVHFRDNGSGVALENKEGIFDAFFTTHEHGTGLGLSLVRRIVEGHGGAIRETGVPGEGADFEMYLPVAGQQRPPARKRAVTAQGGRKRKK